MYVRISIAIVEGLYLVGVFGRCRICPWRLLSFIVANTWSLLQSISPSGIDICRGDCDCVWVNCLQNKNNLSKRYHYDRINVHRDGLHTFHWKSWIDLTSTVVQWLVLHPFSKIAAERQSTSQNECTGILSHWINWEGPVITIIRATLRDSLRRPFDFFI